MSVSKANELLQELYERLKCNWENNGKYKGEKFTIKEVKELMRRILQEYDNDTNIKERDRADNQE